MTKQIPEHYFDNLENYEDFLLRKTLLGFELDEKQLNTFFYLIDIEKIWFIETQSGIKFINLNGEQIFPNSIKDFMCSFSYNSASLKGAPQIVTRNFSLCDCKNLTSLKGAPREVGGDFSCSYCKNLTSFEDTPQKVGKNFYCSHCKNLTSLEGTPQKIIEHFICSDCNKLTSLKGAPQEVGGDFVCLYCESLTSLEGAPIKVKEKCYIFDCDKLSTKQIDDYLEFLKNPTPEHIDSTGHYKP